MPHIVSINAPRQVSLRECPPQPLLPGSVRIRTWYSGISAGTELTAYRGTNPYLSRSWDGEARLFRDGGATFSYPIQGWGYSEVGEIVERATDVTKIDVGQVVYGIWGQRSEAVVPAAAVAGHHMTGHDPRIGCFARVGAIALNALFAVDTRLGDRVAIFGQRVIGLLATRLADLSGAQVLAVDSWPHRLALARELGAAETVDARCDGGVGATARAWSGGAGVDAAVELSGNVQALYEAIRSVVVDGVVAAAVLPGRRRRPAPGRGVPPQPGPDPRQPDRRDSGRARPALGDQRLVSTFIRLALAGEVDVMPLITDVIDAENVASAYARLDRGDPGVLQVLLRFDAAPSQ